MPYQFDGETFETKSAAVAALAEDFICAGGLNSAGQVAEAITRPGFADDAAREILDDWHCNIGPADAAIIPTRAELAAAIRSINPLDFAP